MLAASALIMVILGAGVCFSLIGQDDHEPETDENAADMPIEDDGELTFLTIEDILADNAKDGQDEDDDVFLEDPSDGTKSAEPLPEPRHPQPEATRIETEIDDKQSVEEPDIDATPASLISGGPGDTLTGTDDINRFEVTLGASDDAPTTIENFMKDSLSPDAPPLTDTETLLEKIWFRDEDGTVLSRDAIFDENITIEENEDIDGVSLLFQARQTIHITNITLAEFTENSLVIGNYGIQAA